MQAVIVLRDRPLTRAEGAMRENREVIRALLVEDNRADFLVVRESLAEVSSVRFELVHVERLAAALERIAAQPFDVLLLDLSLPDAQGLEIIHEVCSAAPQLPVLALTGLDDEQIAIRAVQEGAQDYLIKGQIDSGQLLVRAIRYAIERKRSDEMRRFLAEASVVLSASLDYPTTLRKLVGLIVPGLADWCAVDVLERDGSVQRLEAMHVDPAKGPVVGELWRRQPLQPGAPGIARVLHEGRSELIPDVAALADAETLGSLPELGTSSFLAVPLVAHGGTFGAISLGRSGASLPFGAGDLVLVEDLGRRAALALDNARLYREARQAVRARDQVLAVVSHDLKNPLNTIALSVGLLQNPALPEDWRAEQLTIVNRSVDRMRHLIADLLDLARVEAGGLSVEPVKHEAVELVDEALDLHRPLARERHVLLERHMAEDLPPVRADRERILQVFSNLIGNALKFTAAGGRIWVDLRAAEAEVQFSVMDTGSGIAEEDLPHLFDPYWQGKRGRREGAGLGLAITRGIVSAHGGRLWVESRPGEGSRFHFTLPAALQQDGTGPLSAQPAGRSS
jgi:signal transduction histidine kinase/CheY-like chemotaxis protein